MPINSIISQPVTNDAKAAYRPIVFKVNAAEFLTVLTYQVTAYGFGITFGPALPSNPAPGATITIEDAGALNGSYTVASVTSTALYTVIVTVENPPDGVYGSSVKIKVNGVYVTRALKYPPVVYCDIYVESVYYKTIHKTQPTTINDHDSDWSFDIQDACQEVLEKVIAVNGQNTIVAISQMMKKVKCKFRSSYFDSNGFIVAEDTAPVQGTGTTAPVSGTGTESNEFYIVNATLQHEHNQDLKTHLGYYKKGGWGSDTYPMTHRPGGYRICRNSADVYPIMSFDVHGVKGIRLDYTYNNVDYFTTFKLFAAAVMGPSVFYIPSGTKNLSLIGFANFPQIDWTRISRYYLSVENGFGTTIANHLFIVSDCNCEDGVRIHFLNYLGTFDAIGFSKPSVIHEPTSESYQNPLNYPLAKTDTGYERFNVKSNDLYEAKVKCLESEMSWIQECLDSPKGFMEWRGIEGQSDSYLPIVIQDTKIEKLKNVAEFDYEFTIQFKLANDFITIRN